MFTIIIPTTENSLKTETANLPTANKKMITISLILLAVCSNYFATTFQTINDKKMTQTFTHQSKPSYHNDFTSILIFNC